MSLPLRPKLALLFAYLCFSLPASHAQRPFATVQTLDGSCASSKVTCGIRVCVPKCCQSGFCFVRNESHSAVARRLVSVSSKAYLTSKSSKAPGRFDPQRQSAITEYSEQKSFVPHIQRNFTNCNWPFTYHHTHSETVCQCTNQDIEYFNLYDEDTQGKAFYKGVRPVTQYMWNGGVTAEWIGGKCSYSVGLLSSCRPEQAGTAPQGNRNLRKSSFQQGRTESKVSGLNHLEF